MVLVPVIPIGPTMAIASPALAILMVIPAAPLLVLLTPAVVMTGATILPALATRPVLKVFVSPALSPLALAPRLPAAAKPAGLSVIPPQIPPSPALPVTITAIQLPAVHFYRQILPSQPPTILPALPAILTAPFHVIQVQAGYKAAVHQLP